MYVIALNDIFKKIVYCFIGCFFIVCNSNAGNSSIFSITEPTNNTDEIQRREYSLFFSHFVIPIHVKKIDVSHSIPAYFKLDRTLLVDCYALPDNTSVDVYDEQDIMFPAKIELGDSSIHRYNMKVFFGLPPKDGSYCFDLSLVDLQGIILSNKLQVRLIKNEGKIDIDLDLDKDGIDLNNQKVDIQEKYQYEDVPTTDLVVGGFATKKGVEYQLTRTSETALQTSDPLLEPDGFSIPLLITNNSPQQKTFEITFLPDIRHFQLKQLIKEMEGCREYLKSSEVTFDTPTVQINAYDFKTVKAKLKLPLKHLMYCVHFQVTEQETKNYDSLVLRLRDNVCLASSTAGCSLICNSGYYQYNGCDMCMCQNENEDNYDLAIMNPLNLTFDKQQNFFDDNNWSRPKNFKWIFPWGGPDIDRYVFKKHSSQKVQLKSIKKKLSKQGTYQENPHCTAHEIHASKDGRIFNIEMRPKALGIQKASCGGGYYEIKLQDEKDANNVVTLELKLKPTLTDLYVEGIDTSYWYGYIDVYSSPRYFISMDNSSVISFEFVVGLKHTQIADELLKVKLILNQYLRVADFYKALPLGTTIKFLDKDNNREITEVVFSQPKNHQMRAVNVQITFPENFSMPPKQEFVLDLRIADVETESVLDALRFKLKSGGETLDMKSYLDEVIAKHWPVYVMVYPGTTQLSKTESFTLHTIDQSDKAKPELKVIRMIYNPYWEAEKTFSSKKITNLINTGEFINRVAKLENGVTLSSISFEIPYSECYLKLYKNVKGLVVPLLKFPKITFVPFDFKLNNNSGSIQSLRKKRSPDDDPSVDIVVSVDTPMDGVNFKKVVPFKKPRVTFSFGDKKTIYIKNLSLIPIEVSLKLVRALGFIEYSDLTAAVGVSIVDIDSKKEISFKVLQAQEKYNFQLNYQISKKTPAGKYIFAIQAVSNMSDSPKMAYFYLKIFGNVMRKVKNKGSSTSYEFDKNIDISENINTHNGIQNWFFEKDSMVGLGPLAIAPYSSAPINCKPLLDSNIQWVKMLANSKTNWYNLKQSDVIDTKDFFSRDHRALQVVFSKVALPGDYCFQLSAENAVPQNVKLSFFQNVDLGYMQSSNFKGVGYCNSNSVLIDDDVLQYVDKSFDNTVRLDNLAIKSTANNDLTMFPSVDKSVIAGCRSLPDEVKSSFLDHNQPIPSSGLIIGQKSKKPFVLKFKSPLPYGIHCTTIILKNKQGEIQDRLPIKLIKRSYFDLYYQDPENLNKRIGQGYQIDRIDTQPYFLELSNITPILDTSVVIHNYAFKKRSFTVSHSSTTSNLCNQNSALWKNNLLKTVSKDLDPGERHIFPLQPTLDHQVLKPCNSIMVKEQGINDPVDQILLGFNCPYNDSDPTFKTCSPNTAVRHPYNGCKIDACSNELDQDFRLFKGAKELSGKTVKELNRVVFADSDDYGWKQVKADWTDFYLLGKGAGKVKITPLSTIKSSPQVICENIRFNKTHLGYQAINDHISHFILEYVKLGNYCFNIQWNKTSNLDMFFNIERANLDLYEQKTNNAIKKGAGFGTGLDSQPIDLLVEKLTTQDIQLKLDVAIPASAPTPTPTVVSFTPKAPPPAYHIKMDVIRYPLFNKQMTGYGFLPQEATIQLKLDNLAIKKNKYQAITSGEKTVTVTLTFPSTYTHKKNYIFDIQVTMQTEEKNVTFVEFFRVGVVDSNQVWNITRTDSLDLDTQPIDKTINGELSSLTFNQPKKASGSLEFSYKGDNANTIYASMLKIDKRQLTTTINKPDNTLFFPQLMSDKDSLSLQLEIKPQPEVLPRDHFYALSLYTKDSVTSLPIQPINIPLSVSIIPKDIQFAFEDKNSNEISPIQTIFTNSEAATTVKYSDSKTSILKLTNLKSGLTVNFSVDLDVQENGYQSLDNQSSIQVDLKDTNGQTLSNSLLSFGQSQEMKVTMSIPKNTVAGKYVFAIKAVDSKFDKVMDRKLFYLHLNEVEVAGFAYEYSTLQGVTINIPYILTSNFDDELLLHVDLHKVNGISVGWPVDVYASQCPTITDLSPLINKQSGLINSVTLNSANSRKQCIVLQHQIPKDIDIGKYQSLLQLSSSAYPDSVKPKSAQGKSFINIGDRKKLKLQKSTNKQMVKNNDVVKNTIHFENLSSDLLTNIVITDTITDIAQLNSKVDCGVISDCSVKVSSSNQQGGTGIITWIIKKLDGKQKYELDYSIKIDTKTKPFTPTTGSY